MLTATARLEVAHLMIKEAARGDILKRETLKGWRAMGALKDPEAEAGLVTLLHERLARMPRKSNPTSLDSAYAVAKGKRQAAESLLAVRKTPERSAEIGLRAKALRDKSWADFNQESKRRGRRLSEQGAVESKNLAAKVKGDQAAKEMNRKNSWKLPAILTGLGVGGTATATAVNYHNESPWDRFKRRLS